MAKKFTINGIATGQTIEASQVSQSVQALTSAEAYDIQVSGSLILTGSFIQQTGSATSVNNFQLQQVAMNTGSALPASFGFVAIDSTGLLYSASAGAGAQGSSGAQGTDGGTGTQGEIGSQGNTGGTGPTGSVGTPGSNGSQGGSGAQGTAGSAGSQGETGPVGPDGPSGSNGTQGTEGTIGSTGPQGTDGTTGPTGAQGAVGNTGSQGANGTQGTDGTTGPTGPTGGQGTTGNTGGTGPAGTQGTDGTVGSQGAIGAGTQGADGTNGTQGTDGTNGTQGTDGTVGSQGAIGAGTQGADGTIGGQGTTGTTGPTGTGTQGATGVGSQGTTGVGTQGTDGTVGSQGTTGTTGTGTTGPQGTDGSTGSQGTGGTQGTEGAGGGSDASLNNQVRYITNEVGSGSTKLEAQIMSTGTVFGNKAWSRTGTTVTVTSTSHGLTSNDYIVVRGGSDTYLYAQVTVSNVNTFTFTSGTSGTSSGSDLAYIPAAKITALDQGSGTLQVASAGNIQINSISLSTGTKTSSTFSLTVPNTINNGAGANDALTNQNPPIVGVYRLSDGGFNASGTVSVNTGSPFNRYVVGGINTFINNLIRFQF